MAKSAENTAKIQRGKPFEPGKSGNPAGKPKGSRNQITLAIEALLDGEGEALTKKAIELAKTGDMQALRLCLDRLVPPRKDRPVSFELPAITCAGDAAKASAALSPPLPSVKSRLQKSAGRQAIGIVLGTPKIPH